MAVLRSLLVTLGMNAAQYRAELQRSQNQTRTSFQAMTQSANLFAAQAAAVVTAVTAMAVANSKAVREMDNFAKISGMTYDEMVKLDVVGASVGLTAENMADQFKDAKEKVGEFVSVGTGAMQDFFDIMKMNKEESKNFALEMNNLSGQEIVTRMVAEMEKAGKSVNEMSFALEGMGSDLTKLLPLLTNGAKGMKDISENAHLVSNVLSPEDVEGYKTLANNIDLIAKSFDEIQKSFIAEFVPILNDVTGAIADFSKEVAKSRIEKPLREARVEVAGLEKNLEKMTAKYNTALKFKKMMEEGYKPKSAYEASFYAKEIKQLEFYEGSIKTLTDDIQKAKENLEQVKLDVAPRLDPSLKKPEEKKPETTSAEKTFAELYGGTSTVDLYQLELSKKLSAEAEALADSLIMSTETLEQKYARELELLENNLTDYEKFLEAKKVLDENYAKEKEKNDAIVTQSLLNNEMANIQIMQQAVGGLQQYAQEGSAIAIAAFLASQALAIRQVLVQAEMAKWTATQTAPTVAAKAAMMSSIDAQKYVSLALIGAQTAAGLAGMAHDGTSGMPGGRIPREGTWLLDKGERVYTKGEADRMDRILSGLEGGIGGGGVSVTVQGNIYGDEETKRLIGAAAQQGYSMVYKDIKTNGMIYKNMGRK